MKRLSIFTNDLNGEQTTDKPLEKIPLEKFTLHIKDGDKVIISTHKKDDEITLDIQMERTQT